jgi:hypothetical protein
MTEKKKSNRGRKPRNKVKAGNIVSLRLPDEEHKTILSAAREARRVLSDYIRSSAIEAAQKSKTAKGRAKQENAE